MINDNENQTDNEKQITYIRHKKETKQLLIKKACNYSFEKHLNPTTVSTFKLNQRSSSRLSFFSTFRVFSSSYKNR